MIKILIADDHKIFRQGLVELLSTTNDIDISIEGEVGDGYEALAIIEKDMPDIAIVDISMPHLSGLDVIKEVVKKGLNTKIIILTMHKDPTLTDKVMKLGAHGYILKDNALEDLIYAIKTVIRKGKFISPSISDDVFSFQEVVESKKSNLTTREKDVLYFIARGFTNKEIAKKLCISVKTVETHRARIMNKLDLHKTADLVRHAIETGLLLSWNDNW